MTTIASTSVANRCDANATGKVATEWGERALPCQVRTGLRAFTDRTGVRRFFCGSQGHEANARRRFGVYESEVDTDGMSSAKARDDLRDGVAHFGWRGHDIEVEVR